MRDEERSQGLDPKRYCKSAQIFKFLKLCILNKVLNAVITSIFIHAYEYQRHETTTEIGSQGQHLNVQFDSYI